MHTIINKLHQNGFIHVFFCFCILWCLIYILFVTFFGNGIVPGKLLFYDLAIPSLILFVIGIIINHYAQKTDTILFRRMVIVITALFMLDQGIKVIVVQYQDSIILAIDDWLSIDVSLHTGHFLNTRGIFFPLWMYILLIPAPFLVFRVCMFYKLNKYLVLVSVALFSAGLLCCCIDKIFYGGSYDYINLKQFAIFDLKDIYLLIGTLVISLAMIQNLHLKQLCTDPFDLQYFRYEYCNIKQWLSRKKGKEV